MIIQGRFIEIYKGFDIYLQDNGRYAFLEWQAMIESGSLQILKHYIDSVLSRIYE